MVSRAGPGAKVDSTGCLHKETLSLLHLLRKGLSMTLSKRLLLPLSALLLLLPLACQQEKEPNKAPDEPVNRNVRFGMPSPAKADIKQREDYLIERPQYVLSYNAKTRTPNWVSWALHNDDIGKAARGPFWL